MTTPPEEIRQSDLLNQLVLDRATMETLGRVEVVWMYPSAHRVLGFVCKTGAFGAKKLAFKLSQSTTLGANGILTQSQPDETDATKVRQLETLLNCEVWSDAGHKIGKITDYLFHIKTGAISHYLLASSGWAGIAGDLYQLLPGQVLSLGRKRVLITENTAQTLATYQSGVKQTLAKAKAVLQDDYGLAAEELRSLSKQAQAATDQAKGRFRALTGQLKERARSLSQQAQDTIQSINEQLQEEAQTIAEQARETSQVMTDRLKERSQTFGEQFEDGIQRLGEQVEDGIQTLTVQAKEILEPSAGDDLRRDDWEQDTLNPDTLDSDAPISPESTPSTPASAPTNPAAIDVDDDDEPWIADDEPWIADETETMPVSPPITNPSPPATSPSNDTNPQADAIADDDDEPWI